MFKSKCQELCQALRSLPAVHAADPLCGPLVPFCDLLLFLKVGRTPYCSDEIRRCNKVTKVAKSPRLEFTLHGDVMGISPNDWIEMLIQRVSLATLRMHIGSADILTCLGEVLQKSGAIPFVCTVVLHKLLHVVEVKSMPPSRMRRLYDLLKARKCCQPDDPKMLSA
jgi:hypothetical protein